MHCEAADAALQLRQACCVCLFLFQYTIASFVSCCFLRSNCTLLLKCVPAGRPVQFVLTSWLYAFYWFDYKWSLTNLPLENRVQFFQSHWAYFAGKPAGLGLP